MINTVQFWDQRRAEAHTFEPQDVVIAITSPGSPPADIKGAGEVIQLQFFDVEERLVDEGGRVFEPMTCEQGQIIVDAVGRWADDQHWKYVTVMCEAGVSRSGAVAAYVFTRTFCYFPTAETDTHPNKYMMKVFEELHPNEQMPVTTVAEVFKQMGATL